MTTFSRGALISHLESAASRWDTGRNEVLATKVDGDTHWCLAKRRDTNEIFIEKDSIYGKGDKLQFQTESVIGKPVFGFPEKWLDMVPDTESLARWRTVAHRFYAHQRKQAQALSSLASGKTRIMVNGFAYVYLRPSKTGGMHVVSREGTQFLITEAQLKKAVALIA